MMMNEFYESSRGQWNMPPYKSKTASGKARTVGERIAKLRRERGLTQTELGKLVNVSNRVISYYECETKKPPSHLLPEIAKALRVTTDELLGTGRKRAERPEPPSGRLWRTLRLVERLPKKEQQTILRLIESLAEAHLDKAS